MKISILQRFAFGVCLFICLLAGITLPVAAGIDQVKIMSYNLLNYPGNSSDTATRNPHFRTIMAAVSPDILVVQEVKNQTGIDFFLNNVLNSALSGYAAATFIDGASPSDTENGLFYKTSKFTFISNTPIRTDVRDINEFKLKHILSGDTIRIYSVHLKSGNSDPEEDQRQKEIDSLRKVTNALPLSSNFLVVGDFNTYSSTDSAYLALKQVIPGNEGHAIDPLNLPGNWQNNSTYAQYHTQSPRVNSFGGGVTGGMDDRFDLIMYSKALSIAGGVDFVSGSLVAYGNDGQHLNDSINRPPNNAVGMTIANALHEASDHIPVTALINFNYAGSSSIDLGVQSLLLPASNLCPVSSQTLQVRIKNYSSSTFDFATTNLPVELKVTTPSTIITFNKTINSGTLAAGATLDVTFSTPLNMSASGNYSFKSYTQISSDATHSNDTNITAITVYSVNPATISPSGPVVICNGSSATLTASTGSSYQWSNGKTTSSIQVTSAGNYTVMISDANGCVSVSSPVSVTVYAGNNASITPASAAICNGNPATLAASTGSSYQWSNGKTTASIQVSTAGNYTVTITDTNGCTSISSPASVSVDSFKVSGIIYSESFGTPSANTFINSYSGFQNGAPIAYSSTSSPQSDVRVSNASSGYATASGSGNVFMGTSMSGFRNLIISGINTLSYQNITLSFGVRREVIATDTLLIEVSTDGNIYSPLYITQPASLGIWYYVTASGNIPSTSNLRIRFSKQAVTATGTQFRIDDLKLSYNYYSSSITAGGPTTFCDGNAVTLYSTFATSYLWSNGATTQNITVASPGNYYVVETSNGCTSASNTINVTVNPVVVPSVSISASPAGPVCSGTPVIYTAAAVNGGSSPVYNFQLNGISVQSGQSNTYTTSSLLNNDTVTCILTSNENCASPGSIESNKIKMIVTAPPTWYKDADCDGYYLDGTAITQCSSPGTGYTTTITAGGDCNDSIAAVNPGAAEICGNNIDENCNGQVNENCIVTVNFRIFIEGLYLGNGMMIMGDTVTVSLHESSSPFDLVEETETTFNEFGIGNAEFSPAILNGTYYVVIKHRNSVETWSRLPVLFNSNVINVDFTVY